ncbi:MAG: M3 family oligoendopeptidase [Planctomycetes bacterium]|nr:M3 family oligoendopeptidase [Planctomycetota bacterium]
MQATNEYLHFAERPETLTADWVREFYAGLVTGVPAADAAPDAGAWIALAEEWNALKAYAGGEHSRCSYRFMQDMGDAAAEEVERVVREEIVPACEDGDAALVAALLASPHKAAVAARFGEQLLAVLEVGQGPLAPINSELRVKAGELAKRYDKLISQGEVDVLGETLTLARARGKTSSEDAKTRRAAFEAYYGWFRENRDELAELFDAQVKLRDQMGRNLGFDNFLPLGYAGMARTDYGPAEVARFHSAVREFAAPLFQKLAEDQARALGTPTLRPWDRGFHPERSLPSDVAEPIDEQLDKVGRVFARLSPKLSTHFERMRKEGLIDLENRKGKGAGAFCTSFPDEGRVAIFCNSTGDESDVGTLTHEMGHAFQGWESQWIESVDLQWPTSDGAEVHSMGMEFLSLPFLGEFFTPVQLEAFRKTRWSRAVDIVCYVCVVDAFQQWVYENPAASLDARDAEWMRLQDVYMPGIDWSGEAAPLRATRWYAQLHIYRYPFYYIDYALAETGAMQLALLDAKDHEACLETYLELCRLGGTQSVTKLFAGAGLRSPFDPNVMRDLMAHAATQL